MTTGGMTVVFVCFGPSDSVPQRKAVKSRRLRRQGCVTLPEVQGVTTFYLSPQFTLIHFLKVLQP